MIPLTATDILILPPIVIGWASAATYCGVYCATWAFFKARDRFIRNLPDED